MSQGKFERGIFSTHVLSRTTRRFSGEKCEGSSICFIVPSSSLSSHRRRIQWLNVWCMAEGPTGVYILFARISIKSENKKKHLAWIYCPEYMVYTYDHQYMGWLS